MEYRTFTWSHLGELEAALKIKKYLVCFSENLKLLKGIETQVPPLR